METDKQIQVTPEINNYSRVEDLQNGMARIPEIVTPDKIVKAMVDMLPSDVWNSKTVFLDPACKGGEYLREIYDRLMDNELLQAEFPNVIERSNHILQNQLYGIALSQVSLERTTKKLMGFGFNIKIIPNYIDYLRYFQYIKSNDAKALEARREFLNKEFNREMNIDVVIGNPPYQESTGSGLNESGGKPLFDKFILSGIDTSHRIVCMITPTKWISGNLNTFKEVREAMTNKGHLYKMVDYMNAKDVFPGRSIAGGVSYFLFDKEYTGKTQYTTINGKSYTNERDINNSDIIPRHYVGETVISKIMTKSNIFLSSYVEKDKWHLRTDYEGSQIRSTDNEVEIITPRGSCYAEYDYRPDDCDTYKVSFTRVITGRAAEPDKTFRYNILSSLNILMPGQICNASYMVIPRIKSLEYAENMKKYLETKFARFLILQTLFGIGLTPDRFKYVPLMDMTRTWSDQELYKYFELEDSEIEFIERIIKPMNDISKTSKTTYTLSDIQANYINKTLNTSSEDSTENIGYNF